MRTKDASKRHRNREIRNSKTSYDNIEGRRTIGETWRELEREREREREREGERERERATKGKRSNFEWVWRSLIGLNRQQLCDSF